MLGLNCLKTFSEVTRLHSMSVASLIAAAAIIGHWKKPILK